MALHRSFSSLLVALCLWCCFGNSAIAAEIAVTVRDSRGAPVRDAVIYALPVTGKAPPARRQKVEVQQRDQQFLPYVSVVQTGSAVLFPNNDDVKHHVYSFSPAKKFELPLYAGTPAEPIVFDKPGVVTLGCNIHDWMIAYVLVVPTPWFAVTGADGAAQLRNLPAGAYDIEAWQPRLRNQAQPPRQRVNLPAQSSTAFQLDLKPEVRVRRSPSDTGDGYR
ncbi:methylamine utilization protein [soil metagenome]